MFDRLTAESVRKTFVDTIAKLAVQLDPERRSEAEATSLGAAALLSASQERVEGLSAEIEASKLAESKARSEQQSLVDRAAPQRSALEAQQSECKCLVDRVDELTETIGIMETMISGSWFQVAEEAQADCCSAAEEDKHEALNGDTVAAAEAVAAAEEEKPEALSEETAAVDVDHAIVDVEVDRQAPTLDTTEVHPNVSANDLTMELVTGERLEPVDVSGETKAAVGNLEEQVLMAALCGLDIPAKTEGTLPMQPCSGPHSPRKLGGADSQLTPSRQPEIPTPLRQRRSLGGTPC